MENHSRGKFIRTLGATVGAAGVIGGSSFLSACNRVEQVTGDKISFLISFLYNLVGIGFAITGNLSPIVAAILMPVSSVSVVAFATFVTRASARVLQNG